MSFSLKNQQKQYFEAQTTEITPEPIFPLRIFKKTSNQFKKQVLIYKLYQ
jgi:hypothetical protein